jgi:hypothetical protein
MVVLICFRSGARVRRRDDEALRRPTANTRVVGTARTRRAVRRGRTPGTRRTLRGGVNSSAAPPGRR